MRTRLSVVLAALTGIFCVPSLADASFIRSESADPLTALTAPANTQTWCGSTEQPTDIVGPQALMGGRTVKVVYAYPSDKPNRLAESADGISRDIELVQSFVAYNSGGRKTVRFDRGTTCGPEHLDIQTVQLDLPAEAYLETDHSWRRPCKDTALGPGTLLSRELKAKLGGKHLFLVYGDAMSVGRCPYSYNSVQAIAHSIPADERPGPANRSNKPGNVAMVFGSVDERPYADRWGYTPQMYAHELFHLIGAVQGGAPHSNGLDYDGSVSGHCTDGHDIMCYQSGGTLDDDYNTRKCGLMPRSAGLGRHSYDVATFDEPLDCGGDDYFNPNPRPGSYLATHWNTYNSLWLGSCTNAKLASRCAWGDSLVPED